MKKLIAFSICALMIQIAVSQSFEGYIKWKFTMAGMGSAGKSNMSDADKAKMQEGLKQMKAQLNNPNIQNNPQAKAQIEKTIAMMESQSGGGDMVSSMMPKGITVKMKKGNSLVTMEGGMMTTKTLVLKGSDESIIINDEKKTFTKQSSKSKGTEDGYTVEKTGETAKILNYTCTKYIVKGTDKRSGAKTTTFLWATTEIPGIDYSELYKNASGNGQSFFYKDVQGIPLKTETKTSGAEMTIEATEFKQTSIPDAEFAIPTGYTEKKSAY